MALTHAAPHDAFEGFDVAILGAGAAGLSAARRLGERGVRAVVLEARDRVGGRLHTLHDPAIAVPVELGAEFVHGVPTETWRTLDEAKLAAYELPEQHRSFRNGKLVKSEKTWEKAARLLSKLGRATKKRDLSFDEFLARQKKTPGAVKRAARAYVEGFNAADAALISGRSLVAAERDSDAIEGDRAFRLVKGYGALSAWLRGRLAGGSVDLKLGVEVTHVRWGEGGCEVECKVAGGLVVYKAKKVIVALPLGVLKAQEIAFEPEVPGLAKTLAGLEMGPVMKATLAFDRTMWPDDLSFAHAPGASFPTWWTTRPVRAPVLTAWAGGPVALALSGQKHGEIEKAAITSLSSWLGVGEAKLRERVVAFHVHDWQSDRFSRGAYSYARVGGAKAPQRLEEPVAGLLFFAGEHTHAGMSGTVAGAIASGERAAAQVMAR